MITKLTTSFCERTGTPISEALHNIYPSLHLVVESDATANADFYFVMKVKINGVIIAQPMKFVPNQPSRVTTSISPLLVNHLSSIDYTFDHYDVVPYTVFKIYIDEYYNGMLQDSEYIEIKVRNSKALNTYYEDKYMPTEAGYLSKIFLPNITKYYCYGNSILTLPYSYDNMITLNKPIIRFSVDIASVRLKAFDESENVIIDEIFSENGLINIKLNRIIIDDTSSNKIKLIAYWRDALDEIIYSETLMLDVIYNIEKINNICLYYRNNADTFSTILLQPVVTTYNQTESTYNKQNNLYLDKFYTGGKTRTYAGTSEAVTYISDYFNETVTKKIIHDLLTTKEAYIMRYDEGVQQFTQVNVINVTNSIKDNDIYNLHNVIITLEENIYENI